MLCDLESGLPSFLEPAWIELVVLGVVALFGWWHWRRWSGKGELARQRPGLRDYLLGVEQALAADWRPARRRLHEVVEADPENLPARLVLADVLTRLGETAEAHRHHIYLQRGFGLVSRGNDLALARILLRRGQVQQAREIVGGAEAAAAAATRLRWACAVLEPAASDGVAEEVESLRVQSGSGPADWIDPMMAAAMARRLAHDGLWALETGGAQVHSLYQSATWLDPTDLGVRVLAVAMGETMPATAIAGAAPAFCCGRCGAPSSDRESSCPVCLAPEPFVAAEPSLLERIADPGLVLDAIEESPVHVQRLLDAAFEQGDPAAAKELSAIGVSASGWVIAAGASAPERQQAIAAGILRGMGENAIDPLLETAVEQRTPDGRRFERSDALALVGRVVQSFGRAALPAVEGLTDSRDRDVRRLVLDYFISLGEEPAFERLLVHFPAIELLHRLNEAEPEPLRALVADAREDGLLLGELLRDPVFRRELDVLFAIPEAREPDALCAVLEQRGPSRLLTLALLDQVSVAELRGPVARLLHSFGPQILDELVSAYADHERSAADRQAIGAQLTAIGPEIVHPVCRWIGPAASAMDEDWIELLGTLGSPASRSLSAAFEQSASGDGQRVTNRRLVILRAMAAAGARHALQRLRRAERDPDLLDHIEEALRRPAMDDEPSLGRPQPEDPA